MGFELLDGSGGRDDPRRRRSPRGSAACSRSASTTWTRSTAGTSRSSAIRRSSTRGRLRPPVHAARDATTSCDTTPGAKVFLGLREDADSRRSERRPSRPRDGRSRSTRSDSSRHIRAEQHRLYLIPAARRTRAAPATSSLEISATPYLYTLRFYDWLRRESRRAAAARAPRARVREPRPDPSRRRR